ncbi:MAG TPA: hypothetical protein VGO00_04415 [Kofleriaceae bacterium]|nr:hypothetical protein [Kofleriaceae bacterium]
MTYRSDLDALEARHAALEADVATRTRELDASRRLLDDARAHIRLPVLDNIRVAAPCAADWSKMAGDDRVRHCGDCRKNVYNLSEMTRDEAQALLVAHEGKLCVRYYRRHDGTILTADCPVGTKRRRRRRIVALGVFAALASTVFGFAAKRRGGHGRSEMGGAEAIQGDPMPGRIGTTTMGEVDVGTHTMGLPMVTRPAPATAPK